MHMSIFEKRKCFEAMVIALEGELHQRRVQDDRQHQMAKHDHGQGEDTSHADDAPERRCEAGARNNHGDTAKTEDEGSFELPQDLRRLFEEGGVLNFFGGRAPRHVEAEHVGEEGLRDM